MISDRRGTGSGVLLIGSNEQPPAQYEVRIEYSFEPGEPPALIGYGIRRTDGQPLPDPARRWIEARISTELLDRAYAIAIASEELTLDLGDGDLDLDGQHFPVHGARVTRRYADPQAVEAQTAADLGRKRRRRKITAGFLAEVADVYRAHPDAPTKAVQAWQMRKSGYCSPAQASRYVRAARDAGLLEERRA